ncbi:CopG family transcriptional regulator [Enterococcus faecium]|uniref:ribbon-helix-helix domain-containing protein n=1 Tax=Enterococcus faecium TaxID=1352 RepID=UPI0010C1E968|nr:CopG family transcriptional regulator [Enterococcus faecium]TKO39404.1 CopG family transcriptional regulator [Enterococcus faecium]
MAISNEKKRVVVSLKKDQADTLDKEAKSRGLTKSAIIVLALEKYLKENND